MSGMKVMCLLFRLAPLRAALQAVLSHWTQVRCCGFRPPLPRRLLRMSVRDTGAEVRLERLRARRRS